MKNPLHPEGVFVFGRFSSLGASGLEAEPPGEPVQVAAVQIQRPGGSRPVALVGCQGLLDELALEQIGGGAKAQAGNDRGGGLADGADGRG